VGLLGRWLGRLGAHRAGAASLLDPADLAELEALGEDLVHEYPGAAPEVIVATARRLMARGVPLRAVRDAGMGTGVGQLCFADGTVLTVRGGQPGCLGRVAVQALQGRARLVGSAGWSGRGRICSHSSERVAAALSSTYSTAECLPFNRGVRRRHTRTNFTHPFVTSPRLQPGLSDKRGT